MNLSWEIRGSRYESIGGEPHGGLGTTKTADRLKLLLSQAGEKLRSSWEASVLLR